MYPILWYLSGIVGCAFLYLSYHWSERREIHLPVMKRRDLVFLLGWAVIGPIAWVCLAIMVCLMIASVVADHMPDMLDTPWWREPLV